MTLNPRRLLVRTCVMTFASITAFACKGGSADEQDAPTAVNVRTVVVTAQSFTETVGALGTVSGRAGRMASLSAPAPTRVAKVNVVEGQRVTAGAPLVVLDQSVFLEAERSAAAKVALSQKAYDRAKSLSAQGIIARKDLEQASADLASARSDLTSARRTTQLSVLRSPVSGVVTRMDAILGASVDMNQTLVEVADPSALDVILGMTPSDAGRIHPGAKVTLRAGQSSAGEQLGIGTVMEVGVVIDSVTRNVPVRVVAPTTIRPMRIGETVFGDVAISVHPGAIAIPVEALVPEGDQFKAFVVDAKNVVHARQVIVSSRDTKFAEITKGLVAGDRIVTFGAYGLEDGATVVPVQK